MRKLAITFYSDLFSAEGCNKERGGNTTGAASADQAQEPSLEYPISPEEISEIVQQLSCGKASGVDGLPAEFY